MHQDDKRIRVVIGINDFLIGGAQRSVLDQLKFFDRSKFEFYLITLFWFEDRENFYDFLPKDVKIYKLNFRDIKDIKEWLYLIKILKKIKPDIVSSSLFVSNMIFRILKLLFRYKVIIVECNTYINRRWHRILIDKLLSYVTYKIVGVSKGVTEFTIKQEKINRKKFILIHSGTDIQKINKIKARYNKKHLKKELGFNQENKIIINAARLAGQKNQKLLINAFYKFSKIKQDYKLIILGEGLLRNEIENQIKNLNLFNKVFLLGEKKDIYKYYIISDFAISTSRIEGLSVFYLEAMAFGLPLLSTKTAGTDELIINKKNGYFISDEEINSVVKGMLKMANSDLKSMGLAGIKTSQRFDIYQNVKKYEELFLNCLS